MNNLLQYSIYFIIYGSLFLLFMKGYFPANETGILFASFLIFMTLSYKFAGSVINDELNTRREYIYNQFETLLEQNYITTSFLKIIYKIVISKKHGINVSLNDLFLQLENHLQYNLNSGLLKRSQHISTTRLQILLKDWLTLQNTTLNLSYKLAIKQLLENKITSEENKRK